MAPSLHLQVLAEGVETEAIDQLALHAVQVIILDERSTDFGGCEFLSRVRALYPDPLRIVLSGHTGLEAVLDTINRGAVHRFFVRPWDDEVLRENVREAFRLYWLVRGEVGTVCDGREAVHRITA